MTVREFNGTTDRLVTDVGATSGMTYGTVAALVKFSDLTDFRGIAYVHTSGGTFRSAFGTTNFSKFSINDGFTDSNSNTIGISTGVWYLVVCRKATGAGATPRFSVYNYTTGLWSHAAGSAAINDWTSPGAGGNIQFAYQGGTASIFAGRVAARASWSNTLPWTADASGDAAIAASGIETAAANWASTSPTAFWLFNQAAVTDPVLDLSSAGTADETSRVGTTVVTTDDPPGFNFSLGGGSTNLVVQDALQAQAADSPSLTQVHNLTVQDALQAQSADTVHLGIGLQRVVFPTYRKAIGDGPLLSRYALDHPFSLIKVGGVWTETVTPSLYQLQDAGTGNFFIGGQVYILTDAEAAASGLPAQYLEPA